MSNKKARKNRANQGRKSSPNITQKAALEAKCLAEENQAKLCEIQETIAGISGSNPQPVSVTPVASAGGLEFKIDDIRSILNTEMKARVENTRMADLGHVIDARERIVPLLDQLQVSDDRSRALIANADILFRSCISRLGGSVAGSAVSGDVFDPETMEAVAVEEASDETQVGTIHSAVSLSSYSYGGLIFRPQAVIVYGRGPQ